MPPSSPFSLTRVEQRVLGLDSMPQVRRALMRRLDLLVMRQATNRMANALVARNPQ